MLGGVVDAIGATQATQAFRDARLGAALAPALAEALAAVFVAALAVVFPVLFAALALAAGLAAALVFAAAVLAAGLDTDLAVVLDRAEEALAVGLADSLEVVLDRPVALPEVFVPLTDSLSAVPALNTGTVVAAILTDSPVRGLRPERACRLRVWKVPKPGSVTLSPFWRAPVTPFRRASRRLATFDFPSLVAAAT
jgi:hypothetical protein